MIRFRDGKPLLQELTAGWMLYQWDWTREELKPELHPAYQGAFYCEDCVPEGTEIYSKYFRNKCSVCGVVGLCCRAAKQAVH